VTVVVDVTGTGDRPGIGWRLRRLAIRLAVGAGLAALSWLLSAAVNAGTASADEPTSATASGQVSNGLLGTVVGSLGTVLGDTTTGLTHALGTVTGTVHTVTTTTVTTVTTVVTTVVTPAKSTLTATKTTVPQAVAATPAQDTPVAATHTPARAVPVVPHTVLMPQRHSTSVGRALRTTAPKTTAPRTTLAKTAPRTRHRRPFVERQAPAPVPAPAPQAPSPDVPACAASAGHTSGDFARYAIAERILHLSVPTMAGRAGWSADPATVAARGQCLPATSPD
jgi:hypothetical protein